MTTGQYSVSVCASFIVHRVTCTSSQARLPQSFMPSLQHDTRRLRILALKCLSSKYTILVRIGHTCFGWGQQSWYYHSGTSVGIGIITFDCVVITMAIRRRSFLSSSSFTVRLPTPREYPSPTIITYTSPFSGRELVAISARRSTSGGYSGWESYYYFNGSGVRG